MFRKLIHKVRLWLKNEDDPDKFVYRLKDADDGCKGSEL